MDTREAKRRDKKDGTNSMDEDRLSDLPQPILHHILSLLAHKKAVQTCVLSKTWRYLGPTRPSIDLCAICDKCLASRCCDGENKFCENCLGGNEKAFLSVLDKTLQSYHDQKILLTHEFRLRMLDDDPESISLLEKWVPLLVTPYLAVNTFDIRFSLDNYQLKYFNLPSEVFHIKSLEKIYLNRCRLNQIDNEVIQLNRLQTLSLDDVVIADETLEKIISSCPLIENVSLDCCNGLRTVKMINNKHPKLKHFSFIANEDDDEEDEDCTKEVEIEIDAPALETINIDSCPIWYLHNKYLCNLKSLVLYGVDLSAEFFENFSSKFPCLEELDIVRCIDFDRFHLSSHSIKRLTITFSDKSTKATIDAPNILYFKISGYFPPLKLSFTKISSECKAIVDMRCIEESGDDVLLWFINLYKLLRALGQSQITLETNHDHPLPNLESIGGFNEPVLVEHLCLSLQQQYYYLYPSLPDFLNGLFRICRPRYADVPNYWNTRKDIRFIHFLCTVLVLEREQRVYHWQQDLEEVEMEFWDKDGKEWNTTTLEEFKLLIDKKEKIRFRLKWRD